MYILHIQCSFKHGFCDPWLYVDCSADAIGNEMELLFSNCFILLALRLLVCASWLLSLALWFAALSGHLPKDAQRLRMPGQASREIAALMAHHPE